MDQLLVHIGQTKTGTTTIQSFLHRNQEILSMCGIDYLPRPKQNKSHRYLFHLLYLEHAPEHAALVHHHLKRLFELGLIASTSEQPSVVCERGWAILTRSLSSEVGRTAVVSEELFWHLGGFNSEQRLSLLRILKVRLSQIVKPERMKFFISLRFQADWVESWHNQLVKDTGNTQVINQFIKRLSINGAFNYTQCLKDWQLVFSESQFLIRDFHGVLLNASQPLCFSFLNECGIIEMLDEQQLNRLILPDILQESIHPFLHHWLTIHKPAYRDLKSYRQCIKRASRRMVGFAEHHFPGQKFTLLSEQSIQALHQWSKCDSNNNHYFYWQEASSKLAGKVLIPKPLPKRVRKILGEMFLSKIP